jgi:hypothetical protein
MADQTVSIEGRHREQGRVADAPELDRASAACALSVSVTLLFSTLLTWAKETYEPLHAFMASLTGHHWTTHGIVDVVLFVLLAIVFHRLGLAGRISPQQLVGMLVASVIVAGMGVVGFFLFF